MKERGITFLTLEIIDSAGLVQPGGRRGKVNKLFSMIVCALTFFLSAVFGCSSSNEAGIDAKDSRPTSPAVEKGTTAKEESSIVADGGLMEEKRALLDPEVITVEVLAAITKGEVSKEGEKDLPTVKLRRKVDLQNNSIVYGIADMTVKEARSLGVQGLDGKAANEVVKVRYPKVVIPKKGAIIRLNGILLEFLPAGDRKTKKVFFLNEKGKLTNIIEFKDRVEFVEKSGRKKISNVLYFGPNYEYVVLVTFTKVVNICEKAEVYEKSWVNLIDKNGKIYWEARIPKNMDIDEIKISNDAEYVAYKQYYVQGGMEDREEPYEKVIAYSKDGQEVFSFPRKRNEGYELMHITLSPKGRYLTVKGERRVRNNPDNFILYSDLKTGKSWIAFSWGGPHYLDQKQGWLRCDLSTGKNSSSSVSHRRRPKGASGRGVWGETENMWVSC